MTQVGASTLYSGFRLHMGGPFPTSRSLETRPADVARNAAEASAHDARIEEWAERVTKVGGPAAWLVARPNPDGLALNSPSAMEAYRQMSEVVEAL